MAESTFRTLAGVVQFDPVERTAAGKEIRNVTIRTVGLKEQSMRVSCTLWPSHADEDVAKGDFIVVEGKFDRKTGENKEGEAVTYNNLSVGSILVLGALNDGERIATTAVGSADEPAEDDIPY